MSDAPRTPTLTLILPRTLPLTLTLTLTGSRSRSRRLALPLGGRLCVLGSSYLFHDDWLDKVRVRVRVSSPGFRLGFGLRS